MSSRRSGRALRRLIIFLVVLAILAIAADRAAKWLAEDQLATMAEQEAAQYDVRAADTSVDIGGFGFLPQLVKEEFSTVTLTMQQPTISSIPAEDLTVAMSGVHVPRAALTGGNGAAVTVDTTDVQVRLSPSELAKLAARTTGVDDLTMRVVDGKLHAQLSVRGIEADATIRPTTKNGRIVLAVDELSDSIPSVVRNAITSLLARGIALPKLPFGASLKQVAVQGSSVVLTATAANLKLAG
jgi:hypothetical protein